MMQRAFLPARRAGPGATIIASNSASLSCPNSPAIARSKSATRCNVAAWLALGQPMLLYYTSVVSWHTPSSHRLARLRGQSPAP